jgi:hypothetical protein
MKKFKDFYFMHMILLQLCFSVFSFAQNLDSGQASFDEIYSEKIVQILRKIKFPIDISGSYIVDDLVCLKRHGKINLNGVDVNVGKVYECTLSVGEPNTSLFYTNSLKGKIAKKLVEILENDYIPGHYDEDEGTKTWVLHDLNCEFNKVNQKWNCEMFVE